MLSLISKCFLLSFVLGTHVFLHTKSTAEQAKVYFVLHLYHKLSISPSLKTLSVSDVIQCGFYCLRDDSCLSYNFGLAVDAVGHHICQLLEGDKQQNSHNFVSSQDFYHYDFMVRKQTYKFFSNRRKSCSGRKCHFN